ncbi:MAG: 7,8-didemethyl-8-hydroxy-5-deazariboflavin synthase subunit CofG [Methanocellales archaeon]|nr:7,8-didemethyl-8-hydroxy-5-deazariboflavin synthase subunit CofG [Methanocellales archaeon]
MLTHMPYVTFSKNVFVPVTNICRNRCGYCGFRRDIHSAEASVMTPDHVEILLEKGVSSGCTEALFTFGEPSGAEFGEMLHEIGYSSFIEYVMDLCQMAIDHGLLPHTNAGVLCYADMRKLKPLNASMGLMLETTGEVDAHRVSPGKDPCMRLKTIENAGRLKIPFTSGILVGIGETWDDRIESLLAIRRLHLRHGHIQEVIVQNFVPKPNTPMSNCRAPSLEEMQKVVAIARAILPQEIAIQVPPNLVSIRSLIACGASDLGGISPVTIDHINPEARWPSLEELHSMMGVELRERLPIYPHFVQAGWYSSSIKKLVKRYSDENGFRSKYYDR